jgi:thioredoxin-related protein
MKQLILLVLAIALMAFRGDENKSLSIGDKAPMTDYMMEDVSGKSFNLDALKKENGLLVIFSCNTCPFVIGWEDEYPGLGTLSEKSKVGMVLINSNEAKRNGDDSIEEMKKHHKEMNYNSFYVVDRDSKLANAFGANTTPHVYLFDGKMNLVFKGSINDKYEQKDKVATRFWLKEAIEKLASGKTTEINPAETKNIGCSIKRK